MSKTTISKLESLRERSYNKNLCFDLDKKWIENKLDVKKCEASGIPFDNDKGLWYTHSIDRVNNNQGYIKNNCMVVLLGINVGKGQNCSYEDLYKISKAFVKQYERNNK